MSPKKRLIGKDLIGFDTRAGASQSPRSKVGEGGVIVRAPRAKVGEGGGNP